MRAHSGMVDAINWRRGDGVSGLWIAYLILEKAGLFVWSAIIVWNSLAIWDALSAFAIHTMNPWPEFFMIKLVGSSMLFAAGAMHLVIIFLATIASLRDVNCWVRFD